MWIILDTAMEIATENAEDAENADEEGLRFQAVPSLAFTHLGEKEFVSGVPAKPLLLRVFGVLRFVRGNSHRRF